MSVREINVLTGEENIRDYTQDELASIELAQEAAIGAIRESMVLSFSQLLIGLVREAWITENEGDAWADGVLPTAVTSLIATLPQDQQFTARTHAKKATVIMRMDPLVQSLGLAQGKTVEELDQFFIKYSTA